MQNLEIFLLFIDTEYKYVILFCSFVLNKILKTKCKYNSVSCDIDMNMISIIVQQILFLYII